MKQPDSLWNQGRPDLQPEKPKNQTKQKTKTKKPPQHNNKTNQPNKTTPCDFDNRL